MRVFFAEKPSVGRTIAEVLGNGEPQEGYIQCGQDVVTWGFGHLYGIADPKLMNPEWESWNKGILPMVPEEWLLEPHGDALSQVAVINDLFEKADVIVNACDAGREGELIFRWAYGESGVSKPMLRLWISDLSKTALKKGLDDLKEGSAFDALFYSAETRAKADWLLGLNLTRALTLHHGALLNVGRVQTPTLAMVAERQAQNERFEKKPFFEVHVNCEGWKLKLAESAKGEPLRYETRAKAQESKGKIPGSWKFVVEKSVKDKAAPQLYDLTSLQAEMNRKYGTSAADTLAASQKLYEKGLLSYPRTESRHLGEGMVANFSEILKGIPQSIGVQVGELEAFHPGKRFVDDAKLTDHYAIIPTGECGSPKGKIEEYLYEEVWKRFVQMFLGPCTYEEVVVVGEKGQDEAWLYGKEKVVQKAGFTLLSPVKEECKVTEFEGGAREIPAEWVTLHEGTTEPPKLFTDGTLLNAMKNVGRKTEGELAAYLKGGLGTAATRADTIEKLLRCGFLQRSKKVLKVTDLGLTLLSNVPERVKTPELTASWELLLSEIESGKTDAGSVLDGLCSFLDEELPKVYEQTPCGLDKVGTCPKCSSSVVARKVGYGCAECDFIIWKEVAGKVLDLETAQTLIAKGKTGLLKGFQGKNGSFQAALKLDPEFKVVFLFEDQKVGTCPSCREGKVMQRQKFFGCSRWEQGCAFKIWRDKSGHQLTSTMVTQLLNGKVIGPFGFKGKQKLFKAKLKLVGSELQYEFVNAKNKRSKK